MRVGATNRPEGGVRLNARERARAAAAARDDADAAFLENGPSDRLPDVAPDDRCWIRGDVCSHLLDCRTCDIFTAETDSSDLLWVCSTCLRENSYGTVLPVWDMSRNMCDVCAKVRFVLCGVGRPGV